MRPLIVVAFLVALAAPLSGCLDQDAAVEQPPAAQDPVEETAPVVPDGFQAVETVAVSADPGVLTGAPLCGAAAACFEYTFNVTTNASMEALLTWASPTSDFDLHLVEPDGYFVSSAGTFPGDMERIAWTLGPGAHRLVVVGFLTVSDTFTLDVTFAPPS